MDSSNRRLREKHSTKLRQKLKRRLKNLLGMSHAKAKPRLFVLGMPSDEVADFRQHLWAGYEPGGLPGLFVTLPSYSEGGETLSRSAEALAMQDVDIRAARNTPDTMIGHRSHVLCIFDGRSNMNDKADESVFPVLAKLYNVETDYLRRSIDGVLKSNDYCTLQFATPPSEEFAVEIFALRSWEEKEADAYAAILEHKAATPLAARAEKEAAAYEAVNAARMARGVWETARAERARIESQPLSEASPTSRESWKHCWPGSTLTDCSYSSLTLAPLSIDCTGAMLSDARRGTDLLALDVDRIGERVLLKNFSQIVSLEKRNEIIDLMASGELGAVTKHGLYLTVVIKRVNQKKHHSHRLFFDKWLPMHKSRLGQQFPHYAFCSDVGTLYGPRMLHVLMTYLDRHHNVAAVCAHQRIMSYLDQMKENDPNVEHIQGKFLRAVQAFDFESGLAVFNGMQALLGFLPVIPGPCGLFRASDVNETILQRVFDIVTNPAEQDTIIEGNLKIAEDRILSYLLLFMGEHGGKQTHWVPDAQFFFESEDSLSEFVPQRRRWLNGTTAGYIWLVSSPDLWNNIIFPKSASAWFMGVKIFFVSLLQLLVFFVVYSMPGFMALTGYLALSGLFVLLEAWQGNVRVSYLAEWVYPLVRDITIIAYWVAYVGSFVTLVVAARWFRNIGKSNKGIWAPLWTFRIILNGGIMVVNGLVLIGIVVMSLLNRDALVQASITDEDQSTIRFVFLASALYTFTPLFLGMMHSMRSFESMLGSYIPYTLFLPTILVDFFAFSCAKYDDMSWGTKAAVAGTDSGTMTARLRGQRNTQSSYQRVSARLVVFQILLMIIVLIGTQVAQRIFKYAFLLIGGCLMAIGLFLMVSSFAFYLTRTRAVGTLNHYSTIGHIVSTGVPFVGWATCVVLVISSAPSSFTDIQVGIDYVDNYAFGFYLVVFAITFLVITFKWVTGQCDRNLSASEATRKAIADWKLAWPESVKRKKLLSPPSLNLTSSEMPIPNVQPVASRLREEVAPAPLGSKKDARNVQLWQHILRSRNELQHVVAEFNNTIKSVESMHSRRLAWPKFIILWGSIFVLIWLSPIAVFVFSMLSAGERALRCKCFRSTPCVPIMRSKATSRSRSVLRASLPYAIPPLADQLSKDRTSMAAGPHAVVSVNPMSQAQRDAT